MKRHEDGYKESGRLRVSLGREVRGGKEGRSIRQKADQC